MLEITNKKDIEFVERVLNKYKDKISTLINEGIFDVKNCKVITHIDNDGKIRKIETYKVNYKK
jgi:hypothetical protein